MKRRLKIRLLSLGVSAFSAVLIWAICATSSSVKYERQLKLGEQQSLTQLCEYLDNIELNLIKSMYAGQDSMMDIASELYTQASGAKTSLAALSAGDVQLNNTYKFLSQVGAYTKSLNKKAANGGRITEEERKTLEDLLGYAVALSTRFDYMAELMNSDFFTFEKLDKSLVSIEKSSENMVSYMDSADDAEQALTDFPTLIYDGPFSDNILAKESELLKNSEKITEDGAKKKAAEYLGCEEKNIIPDGETDGRIATYNFKANGKNIAVTKHGGYLAYILSDIRAGKAKLTDTDAIEKAAEFLYETGYSGLMSTYFAVNNGICTVNFAFIQDGFICYPDLIKVGVSLSDGDIVSLDASDYIMNHTERTVPEIQISADDAAKNIAETLSLKKTSLAVIPTDGGGEKYTHELLCEGGDGQDVLIYMDVGSGKEENILILLYSDNGVLTK